MPQAICWYHFALSHIGQRRLYDTMSMMYYHHTLRKSLEQQLSPAMFVSNIRMSNMDMDKVAVDLIGPRTLDVANQAVKFHALTIVDLVSNLVEIVHLDNKTTQHTAMQFINMWLDVIQNQPLESMIKAVSSLVGHFKKSYSDTTDCPQQWIIITSAEHKYHGDSF
jgi:hypothetical protein